MDRETYEMVLGLMSKIPPKTETPTGQKFHIGEIVKIIKPNSWFSRERFEKNKEQLYQIEYSFSQKYGGSEERQKKEYSLKCIGEGGTTAWYDESELELVKGIDEINEDQELKEYERLKKKYGR